MKLHTALPLLACCLTLAGCATNGTDYPSLAVRDAERVEMTYLPGSADTEAMKPAPAPDSLPDQLAALRAEADSAHRAFMDAAPGAERTVSAARGAALGSRSWGDAQVAMADLDSLRSRSAVVLADLDLLYTNATVDFVERDAIAQTREAVIGMVLEEDAILARLRKQF
ncbi:MAG: hypothetical protein H6918_11755 [Sphingomonadaceae bacterium]|nr:hypothetical protein [Sphingomonadaceae bacterium]